MVHCHLLFIMSNSVKACQHSSTTLIVLKGFKNFFFFVGFDVLWK